MRTLTEISADLAAARAARQSFGYTNVANKTVEQLAEIEKKSMELDRDVFLLEKERREWVEAA